MGAAAPNTTSDVMKMTARPARARKRIMDGPADSGAQMDGPRIRLYSADERVAIFSITMNTPLLSGF